MVGVLGMHNNRGSIIGLRVTSHALSVLTLGLRWCASCWQPFVLKRQLKRCGLSHHIFLS